MPNKLLTPRLAGSILSSVLLLVTATGCGSDQEDDASTETGSAAESTTATTVPVETTATASVEAATLRTAAAADTELPAGVLTFVNSATDQRLDEIGALVCGSVTADLSADDFESAAIVARDELTAEEQNQLGLAEFGAAFRLMADAYCPDQVPVATDPTDDSGGDDGDSGGDQAADPAPADDLSAYRSMLSEHLAPDHPAVSFVNGIDDDRLDQLQQQACSDVNPEMELLDLSLVALDAYSNLLEPSEQEGFTETEFVEFYGSLVGFFCQDRLPSLDPSELPSG
jgi:hypothetical protein